MTFEVGDLVVCVVGKRCPVYPEATRCHEGATYLVTEATFFSDKNTGLSDWAVRLDRDNCMLGNVRGWYRHTRFRKVSEEAGDEEALREIVRCFNTPQPLTTPVRELDPALWRDLS